jgi:hypothetical protein
VWEMERRIAAHLLKQQGTSSSSSPPEPVAESAHLPKQQVPAQVPTSSSGIAAHLPKQRGKAVGNTAADSATGSGAEEAATDSAGGAMDERCLLSQRQLLDEATTLVSSTTASRAKADGHLSQRQERLDARAAQIEAALVRLTSEGGRLRQADRSPHSSAPGLRQTQPQQPQQPQQPVEQPLQQQPPLAPSTLLSIGESAPTESQQGTGSTYGDGANTQLQPHAGRGGGWQEELLMATAMSHHPAPGHWQLELHHGRQPRGMAGVDNQAPHYGRPPHGTFDSPITTSSELAGRY